MPFAPTDDPFPTSVTHSLVVGPPGVNATSSIEEAGPATTESPLTIPRVESFSTRIRIAWLATEELWDDCVVGVPSAIVVVDKPVSEAVSFADDIAINKVPEPSTSATAIAAMSSLRPLEIARLATISVAHPSTHRCRCDDAVRRGVDEDLNLTASICLADVHLIIASEGLIS